MIATAAFLIVLNLQSASTTSVTGTVRDSAGATLAAASVIVRLSSGIEERTTSDSNGRFAAPVTSEGEVTLIVRAEGFAEHRRTIWAGAMRQNIEVVLLPATLIETVTVTAARTEQLTRNVAASVNLLEREAIARSPAVVADDVLRQIPTFSLFRRTSSLAAHPTEESVRAASAGRSCSSTAFPSTIRLAAGCTGRGFRSARSNGSKW